MLLSSRETAIHSDGTVTSNRAELPAMVKFRPSPASANLRSGALAGIAHSQPTGYPPTGGSGGPYIRIYSYQNINAAYGVATAPCDVSLPNSSTGNMYFNAYDQNGSDLVDAGIGADEYPGRDGNPSDVFPFVNQPSLGGWDPNEVSGTFVNTYQSWSCGTPLVIEYGTLPYPQYESNGYGTSMFVAGIPEYDPMQWKLPPNYVIIQNPSWTFFYTPPGLDSGASTYDGIASNCALCSVALMFTIGESSANGSCYGICQSSNGYSTADATWRNVVMGELVSPCGPNSFGPSNPCTLEYDPSGNWDANSNACSSCNTSYGSSDGTSQEIVEGISDLTFSADARHTQITVQASNLPTAPSSACTPDSHGYCYIQASYTVTASCDETIVGGKPVYAGHNSKTVDYVFKKLVMLELQETATKTVTMCPSGDTTTWSPNNPAVYYNDSNLP